MRGKVFARVRRRQRLAGLGDGLTGLNDGRGFLYGAERDRLFKPRFAPKNNHRG